jgi:hypothetical protein
VETVLTSAVASKVPLIIADWRKVRLQAHKWDFGSSLTSLLCSRAISRMAKAQSSLKRCADVLRQDHLLGRNRQRFAPRAQESPRKPKAGAR